MEKRYLWIDSLKGIAILGVMLVHCGTSGTESTSFLPIIINYGQRGVQIFFLLSAFLAFRSYDGYIHRADKTGTRQKIAWIGKWFLKIIPLYYLALIVSSFVGGNAYWLGSEGHITILNFLSHLSFTHGLVPHYVDSIIGVEWYLGALAIFIVMLPFIHRLINSLEKVVIIFLFVTPLIWYIGIWSCNLINLQNPDAYIYQSYFGNFCIIAQIPVLLLGIILYHIVQRINIKKIKCKRGLSLSLLAWGLILIVGIMTGNFSIIGVNSHTLFGLSFFLIAISQVILPLPIIDNSLFRFLGRNSFPLYLFHFFILNLYNSFLAQYFGQGIMSWIVRYGFVVIASVVVGIILNQTINKLATNKLLQVFKKESHGTHSLFTKK